MQAAALVRMVDAGIPLSSHLTDPTWEGGILSDPVSAVAGR
jgi:hypothetical protein